MATLLNDGDRFVLSRLDVRVLVALSLGKMNAYQIGRLCERDALIQGVRMSNSALQHSLKSLVSLMLVQELPGRTDGPGRPSKLYKLNSMGRLVLERQLDELRHTLALAEERLKY